MQIYSVGPFGNVFECFQVLHPPMQGWGFAKQWKCVFALSFCITLGLSPNPFSRFGSYWNLGIKCTVLFSSNRKCLTLDLLFWNQDCWQEFSSCGQHSYHVCWPLFAQGQLEDPWEHLWHNSLTVASHSTIQLAWCVASLQGWHTSVYIQRIFSHCSETLLWPNYPHISILSLQDTSLRQVWPLSSVAQ